MFLFKKKQGKKREEKICKYKIYVFLKITEWYQEEEAVGKYVYQ